jgi:hypothetical protein
MIKIGAALLSGLLCATACSGGPAYEANSGLIFVGTLVVYYDSEGPLSYQTITPWELPKDKIPIGEVMGDSCQHGISIPIIYSATDRVSLSGAAGDGSYRKALRDIHRKHPDIYGLYDVKVDIERLSILTIYSRSCTIVVAQGFKRKRLGPTPSFSSN